MAGQAPLTIFLNPSFMKPTVDLPQGLTLILTFYRSFGVRTATPRQVVRKLKLEVNRCNTSLVGKAFAYLESKGFVERRNRSRPIHYVPMPALLWWVEEHGCLSNGCSNCCYYGSTSCPFLQGWRGGGQG